MTNFAQYAEQIEKMTKINNNNKELLLTEYFYHMSMNDQCYFVFIYEPIKDFYSVTPDPDNYNYQLNDKAKKYFKAEYPDCAIDTSRYYCPTWEIAIMDTDRLIQTLQKLEQDSNILSLAWTMHSTIETTADDDDEESDIVCIDSGNAIECKNRELQITDTEKDNIIVTQIFVDCICPQCKEKHSVLTPWAFGFSTKPSVICRACVPADGKIDPKLLAGIGMRDDEIIGLWALRLCKTSDTDEFDKKHMEIFRMILVIESLGVDYKYLRFIVDALAESDREVDELKKKKESGKLFKGLDKKINIPRYFADSINDIHGKCWEKIKNKIGKKDFKKLFGSEEAVDLADPAVMERIWEDEKKNK